MAQDPKKYHDDMAAHAESVLKRNYQRLRGGAVFNYSDVVTFIETLIAKELSDDSNSSPFNMLKVHNARLMYLYRFARRKAAEEIAEAEAVLARAEAQNEKRAFEVVSSATEATVEAAVTALRAASARLAGVEDTRFDMLSDLDELAKQINVISEISEELVQFPKFAAANRNMVTKLKEALDLSVHQKARFNEYYDSEDGEIEVATSAVGRAVNRALALQKEVKAVDCRYENMGSSVCRQFEHLESQAVVPLFLGADDSDGDSDSGEDTHIVKVGEGALFTQLLSYAGNSADDVIDRLIVSDLTAVGRMLDAFLLGASRVSSTDTMYAARWVERLDNFVGRAQTVLSASVIHAVADNACASAQEKVIAEKVLQLEKIVRKVSPARAADLVCSRQGFNPRVSNDSIQTARRCLAQLATNLRFASKVKKQYSVHVVVRKQSSGGITSEYNRHGMSAVEVLANAANHIDAAAELINMDPQEAVQLMQMIKQENDGRKSAFYACIGHRYGANQIDAQLQLASGANAKSSPQVVLREVLRIVEERLIDRTTLRSCSTEAYYLSVKRVLEDAARAQHARTASRARLMPAPRGAGAAAAAGAGAAAGIGHARPPRAH